MKIKKIISAFITLIVAQVFAMIFTGQTVLASTIGAELVRVGQEASQEAVTTLSDIVQDAVGPVLLAVSILFLLYKIATAFMAHRRNDSIDVMGLIIALIAVIVTGLITTISIGSFVN